MLELSGTRGRGFSRHFPFSALSSFKLAGANAPTCVNKPKRSNAIRCGAACGCCLHARGDCVCSEDSGGISCAPLSSLEQWEDARRIGCSSKALLDAGGAGRPGRPVDTRSPGDGPCAFRREADNFVEPNEVISHGLGTPVMSHGVSRRASHIMGISQWGVLGSCQVLCLCMSRRPPAVALAGRSVGVRFPSVSAPSVLSLPLGVVVRVVRTAGLLRRLKLAGRQQKRLYTKPKPRHHSMLGVKPPRMQREKRAIFHCAKVLIHGFSPRNH